MPASCAEAPAGKSGWKPCSSMEAWAAATRLKCAGWLEGIWNLAPCIGLASLPRLPPAVGQTPLRSHPCQAMLPQFLRSVLGIGNRLHTCFGKLNAPAVEYRGWGVRRARRLEQNQSNRALFGSGGRGFFLRKKPLEGIASGYSYSG